MHDLTAAGFNMMNSLPVTSTGGYDKADSAGCDVRAIENALAIKDRNEQSSGGRITVRLIRLMKHGNSPES